MSIGTPTSLGSSTGASGVSSITITTTAAIIAGNLVVVFINLGEFTAVASVSDGTNVYSKAKFQPYDGSDLDAEVWYCANASAVGSGASLTATLNTTSGGSVPGWNACAVQVSGLSTTSPLDVAISNNTSSASPSLATGTLTQSSEIIFGLSSGNYDGTGSPTYTESAGFTNLFNFSPGSNFYVTGVGYKIVSSNSSVTYNPSWTAAPFSGMNTFVVSFATAPVTPIPPPIPIGLLNSSNDLAGTTTLTFTTTANIPAGSLVVVIGFYSQASNSGQQFNSVSDGTNTYTKAINGRATGTDLTDMEIWYCANAKAVASGATMTAHITNTTNGSGYGLYGFIVSGMSVNPLDKTASDTVTTTTPSCSSGTLSRPIEIVFGCSTNWQNAEQYTSAPGWNNLVNVNQIYSSVGIDYLITSSAGSVTYDPTWSSDQFNVVALLASFMSQTLARPYQQRRVYLRR